MLSFVGFGFSLTVSVHTHQHFGASAMTSPEPGVGFLITIPPLPPSTSLHSSLLFVVVVSCSTTTYIPYYTRYTSHIATL